MRQIITVATILMAMLYVPLKTAHAAGTVSGTTITNTATVTYDLGVNTGLTATASTNITVDNKVIVTVTKNADTSVVPGSTNEALVFVVTNNGNTAQRYALSVTNSAGIVMDNVRIYLDDGDTPNVWDAADTPYVDAGTFDDVNVDGSLDILIVADTPGAATNGQTSDYNLVATTVDASTTDVTTQTLGANTAGVDVVFADVAGSAAGDGARDGKHSAAGKYTVSTLSLAITKAVFVYSDPHNGVNDGSIGSNYSDCTVCPKAIPDATLRYTITVTVTGSGIAAGVIITDPIPANSTYKTGTLKLNGGALSDGTGDDAGDVGGTTAGTVTVDMGDLTAPIVQTVEFDVTID